MTNDTPKRLVRALLLFTSMAAFTGCGSKPLPTLAGGKPVLHWIESLHDSDAKVRQKAVRELGGVGTADPAALPALTDAVRDPDDTVRNEAILALLRLGPAAKSAVPVLTEAQGDRNVRIRANATKALERIQSLN